MHFAADCSYTLHFLTNLIWLLDPQFLCIHAITGGSHITAATILAQAAKNVRFDNFTDLINKVTARLSSETGTIGNLKIVGKLVTVPPEGEAVVIGDLHGDLDSLIHILDESRFLEKIKKARNIWLLFLGDYGDRGVQSPEVYHVALTLKEKYPENVILLRGNHEGPVDLRVSPHDLKCHLENKFGENGSQAYTALRRLFGQLYTAVLIEDRVVLVHGGVPIQAKTLKDIAYAHQTHPKNRILEEILWNDPHPNLKGTISSPRGLGNLFGVDVTRKFLRLLNVNSVIRSHQFCENGYKNFHQGTVLTLFSTKSFPYHNKWAAYLEFEFTKKLKTSSKQLLQGIHKF